MTNDPEQFFEDLAKSYPELMEKSKIGDHIGVGAGWFSIIETLCGCIYNPVYQAKSCLKGATEYPRKDGGLYLQQCQEQLATAIEELPSIVQIKEKFGTLRFYYSGGSDRVSSLVDFAEAMTAKTCEECGAPGKSRSGGWIRTVCDAHARKSSNDEDQEDIEEGTVSAKIEDDDPSAW